MADPKSALKTRKVWCWICPDCYWTNVMGTVATTEAITEVLELCGNCLESFPVEIPENSRTDG